jgi:hypothetical protein
VVVREHRGEMGVVGKEKKSVFREEFGLEMERIDPETGMPVKKVKGKMGRWVWMVVRWFGVDV